VNPARAWLKVSAAATIMTAHAAHQARIRLAVHIAIANGTAAVSRHANIASDAVIARNRNVSPRYGNCMNSPIPGAGAIMPLRCSTMKIRPAIESTPAPSASPLPTARANPSRAAIAIMK